MWPFRSRRPGKHSYGAAVTAIPAQTVPVAVAAPELPRVELGFRDGTTAALAPNSVQAQALRDIASALTRRE
jgi:hypothetical protein